MLLYALTNINILLASISISLLDRVLAVVAVVVHYLTIIITIKICNIHRVSDYFLSFFLFNIAMKAWAYNR